MFGKRSARNHHDVEGVLQSIYSGKFTNSTIKNTTKTRQKDSQVFSCEYGETLLKSYSAE